MANKNLKIFLEGEHEEIFIKDWREKHGTFFKQIKTKVIHMNQIDAHCDSVVDAADEIIVIVDDDDQVSNSKIKIAKNTAECNNVIFTLIKQKPDFDTFCATFFKKFIINKSLDQLEIREEARVFLNKINDKFEKKWTYTKIKLHGGNIMNAKRYKKRFKILDFLKT